MFLSALPCVGLVALAAALPTPDGGASIINTRGTTEPQGESLGFATVNAKVHESRPGGKTYNTVYPADWDQNSTAATEDIFNQVHAGLAANADECFILEGYSQGATATVDALARLTDAAFNAVKGVLLIGNPLHKAGLACNVDLDGGDSTFDVDGIWIVEERSDGIPDNWVPKTLDVCNFGDGVCDTKNGEDLITEEHLAYITDDGMHEMGAKFVLGRL
ncbi:hypothetical protein K4F52_006888 [Lecanicillium sp. MT-2017a]|nr:hypothetical protein K4F52_006888 [Lecanicillium sp. MT-2017a]